MDSDQKRFDRVFEAAVVASALELFAHYGALLTHERCGDGGPVNGDDQGIVVVIGFSCARMRGSLTIYAPLRLLETTYPLEASPLTRLLDLEDWAREVGNQLVGRLSVQIKLQGLRLASGLPSTVSGRDYKVATGDAGTGQWHTFAGASAPGCQIRIDKCYESGFCWEPGNLNVDESEDGLKIF